jgi:hypothetical protein
VIVVLVVALKVEDPMVLALREVDPMVSVAQKVEDPMVNVALKVEDPMERDQKVDVPMVIVDRDKRDLADPEVGHLQNGLLLLPWNLTPIKMASSIVMN